MNALAPITAETAPRHVERSDPAPPRAEDRGAVAAVSRVQPSEKVQPRAEDQPTVKAAPARRGSTARLSYDQTDKRVYVEIVDPQTGDVFQRLPPEILSDSKGIDGTQPGSIFDRTV